MHRSEAWPGGAHYPPHLIGILNKRKLIIMTTKEQIFARFHAIEAIRKKTNYDRSRMYRWTIGVNPANLKELKIHPYSSVVSGFGFETKQEAEAFMKDEENLKLLNEAYL